MTVIFGELVFLFTACKNTTSDQAADSVATEVAQDTMQSAHPNLVKANASDSTVLLQFFQALHGNLWIESWSLNSPVQYWKGITLSDEGRVVEIILPANNLNGTIPRSFTRLSELRNIDFKDNPIKGSVFIAGDNEGYGTKYDFNSSLSESNEVKLRDSIWYLYSVQTVPVYASLTRDTIVKQISNSTIGKDREIIIEDDGITNPSAGTTVEDGLMGRYIKVSVPSLDIRGYMFSGFLTRFPPIESFEPEGFAKKLLLLNSYKSNCCVKWDGSNYVHATNEERNGSDWGYQFERGISITGYRGYEWGGNTISFDATYLSFQEGYLIAKEMYQNIFDQYGVAEFPSRQMQFKPNDYTKVTVEFEGPEIQAITIEVGDGCVEEWFIRKIDGKIEIGSSAGC